MSFQNIKDHDLELITDKLNNRTRKALGFNTPKEILNKYLSKNNSALIN